MNEKKKNITTWVLVILLVVAAFAIGSMRTKIGYLEQEKKVVGAATTPKETTRNPNQAAAAPAGKVTINDNDHTRGDKNAPITLVEFSDFQCPFCQRFHPTMQKVIEDYQGKVRWIYRHFPLGFHQNAQKSAEASECAGEQGKFWEYADSLFENSQADGTGLNLEDLKKYANELGLDSNKFNDCLSSDKFANKVKDDMAAGQAAGVTGTPGTILIDKNGDSQLISGALPFEQIKAKIDAAL
jgi:protein-disulfide isomerase